MADVFNIEEVREIVSVVADQLPLFNKALNTINDEALTAMVTQVTEGSLLLQGQLVMFKSTSGGTVLGSMPAIVTDVARPTAASTTYTLAMLTGDLNDELLPVQVADTKLADAVTISDDLSAISEAVITTMLGSTTLREMKVRLGISHLLVFDPANTKFKSFA